MKITSVFVDYDDETEMYLVGAIHKDGRFQAGPFLICGWRKYDKDKHAIVYARTFIGMAVHHNAKPITEFTENSYTIWTSEDEDDL